MFDYMGEQAISIMYENELNFQRIEMAILGEEYTEMLYEISLKDAKNKIISLLKKLKQMLKDLIRKVQSFITTMINKCKILMRKRKQEEKEKEKEDEVKLDTKNYHPIFISKTNNIYDIINGLFKVIYDQVNNTDADLGLFMDILQAKHNKSKDNRILNAHIRDHMRSNNGPFIERLKRTLKVTLEKDFNDYDYESSVFDQKEKYTEDNIPMIPKRIITYFFTRITEIEYDGPYDVRNFMDLNDIDRKYNESMNYASSIAEKSNYLLKIFDAEVKQIEKFDDLIDDVDLRCLMVSITNNYRVTSGIISCIPIIIKSLNQAVNIGCNLYNHIMYNQ